MATCLYCKRDIYFKPGEFAEEPGHVYSEMGRREVRISGLCEFCFDEITTETELMYGDKDDDD